MDFTIIKYKVLLAALKNQGFSFQTFNEFLEGPTRPLSTKGASQPTEKNSNDSEELRDGVSPRLIGGQVLEPVSIYREGSDGMRVGSPPLGGWGVREGKTIILRHDVDLLPNNSLRFAEIQHEMGIKGSYYFRAVPESWDEKVIKKIADLGHEIGYHYECLTTTNGDMKAGIADFEKNLEALRKLASVNTICMHGSPKSKWDSKDLWKEYYYRDYGIIGEPYFDVNFDEVFYLTDTGRRWDGWKVSVRDKVPQQEDWVRKGLVFRSTGDIIRRIERRGDQETWGLGDLGTKRLGDLEMKRLGDEETRGQGDKGTKGHGELEKRGKVEEGAFPDRVMFTFHPQRWHNSYYLWLRELIIQNAKNQIKGFIVKNKAKK
jgi:hypothetical protein